MPGESRIPLFLTAILVAVLLSAAASVHLQTQWDQPFLYACHRGKILKTVYSVHDNRREDRRWSFSCGQAPGGAAPHDCLWTGYVNGWDAVMNFVCPRDYLITGLQSYHDNRREDRRFKFKCCTQKGYQTYSCSLTPYKNGWDGPLNYAVPNEQVFVGWAGFHDNHRE
ncbi:hemagglutinin/amebocyte aggregation factor [Plakobranchus ocellatus]|uniref:Hemagglutinin/amebocyte aggregation factor n=1 Tax=Plakobranchus ocellatus TaxID=259542 RepID=A0AAV4CMC7_9GAST|nr:hemagglutinin/amebocyte aggregation factor [Plakobranchus ocellatus]